jgi:hypothetical protein
LQKVRVSAPAPRRTFRVPPRVESTRADGDSPRFLGYAGNLSTTGLFVQSLVPRSPGARIDLRIHLPTPAREVVTCVGEVVWAQARIVGPEHPPGMGIRFVAVAPEGLEALERFCRSESD